MAIGGTTIQSIPSSTSIAAGTVYHVIGCWRINTDGTGIAKLFLDGELEASASQAP